MENKGGEVRRIHIIYFLSHIGGRADHPHLIRVLHLARNGVYLRDVKRWLGELRGKDLPEAFSWSYKRRYKTGYVWQDLFDDDLITPISDNEYVLKGSQIHPTTFEIISPDEKKTASNVLLSEKKSPQVHVAKDNKKTSLEEEQQQPRIRRDTDSKTDTPTKVSSSEISQDSLVFSSDRLSSVTDEYDEDNKPLEESRKESFEEQNNEKLENSSSSLPSLYHNLLNKNGSNKQDLNKTDTPDSSISTPSSLSSSQSSFSKLRSNSTRVSTALRNLITCGSVDTIDATLIRMKPNQKTVSNINDPNNLAENKAQICKGDRLGGSARCFRNSWNHHCQQNQYGARKSFDAEETNRTRKKLGDFMNQTQHKPFGGPICSQCRKQFKPEKMHKHMKSCKGMKVLGTTVSDAEKTQHHRSSTSDHSNYLLTN